MRFDRFITLNLVQPWHRSLLRIGWGEGGRSPDEVHFTRHPSLVTSLPILMYHSISDDPESGVRPYYRVCTSPQRFREQMQWLKDKGYRGVTLSDGLAWLDTAKQKVESRDQKAVASNGNPSIANRQSSIVNTKLVVLTFDDGFHDFHTAAWPVLQEFGFTATMYLPTAYVGGGSCHSSPVTRHSFHGKECLTWNEVNELHHAGIEFGSHTVTHPKLTGLSLSEIESEIRDSKSEIENRLGVPCATIAYPYAFPQTNRDFVGLFQDLLMTGGYATCVTTQIGRHRPGANLLQIKRLPVNQVDDLLLFAAKLAGAYDWLGRFQAFRKMLRRSPSVLARNSKPEKQDVRAFALPAR